jgi:hypothetical protein
MDFVVGCAPVYDGSSSFNHAYVLYRKCDYSVTQLQQPGQLRGSTNINEERGWEEMLGLITAGIG